MSSSSAPASLAGERKNFTGLLRTMRPRQWVKSVIVFAALVFDGKLFVPELFAKTLAMFIAFCLISSSVYIINDLVDMEKDRQHPRKRSRPLASGQLEARIAVAAAALLAVVAMGGAFWLDLWAGVVLLIYLVQNIAYSFWLKNIVILDVMVLAFGFLLRVLAGVVVVQVDNFSPWLYICVTLLALFLGFGKRRQEIVLLEGEAANHRAILSEYNLPLLDQIISMVVTATLVSYTFYSFDATTALAHSKMLLTVPFVFYMLARYLYLVHVKHLGGAPDELLLEDRPLLMNSILWAMAVVALIYVWK
ncbi:MAG: decaprenyl-phosphate phosphoribosyltransferase [Caldilinea sp.]|uniref:decaprenyl-phosphate phosphoribosyltransferase n=1 Tax=Caldilinea sp. TaxID=2293560 RepID=UPI002D09929B|nr:decaprenyl-phosphate phosphoribosyltransferase [Caldilinea sp.]HRA66420.1 decaprenyl-phosphate phosphoribosyltransferase [Caldilinea sp.]